MSCDSSQTLGSEDSYDTDSLFTDDEYESSFIDDSDCSTDYDYDYESLSESSDEYDTDSLVDDE